MSFETETAKNDFENSRKLFLCPQSEAEKTQTYLVTSASQWLIIVCISNLHFKSTKSLPGVALLKKSWLAKMKNIKVIALKIDNVIQSDKIPFQTTHQLQDINKNQNSNNTF